MKEIEIKDNGGRKIYIDELPIEELIPPNLLEIFVNVLVEEIDLILKTKEKRRKYYQNSKDKKSDKNVS